MAIHPHDDDPELNAALERLFSLQTFGIKLGLDPISALLDEMGNPHQQFPVVHVAGTNGKGSVCALVASVLRETGLRVGLYTSPHLLHFTERIRVNGTPMLRERLALYAREMLPIIEHHNCTFFEGTTAIGFRYFAEEQVDIAVVETGLGGRLDATNVVAPLVTAVTSIAYDHMKHLGDTLEQIAAEKAGIFKRDIPAIIGRVEPRLRPVFTGQGARVGADVHFIDDFCHAIHRSMDFDSTTASFLLHGSELQDVRIGLVGRHQIENARVALGIIDVLGGYLDIDETAVRRGFGNVRANSGIRGRCESVHATPRVILDVAHNPDGMNVLVNTLAATGAGTNRAIRFVYGAVQDKDVGAIAAAMAPSAKRLYAVRADSHRSLSAEEIAHHTTRAGIDTAIAGAVENGMRMALNEAESDELIVICGSFFVVADAIAAIDSGALQLSNAPGFRAGDARKLPAATNADGAHEEQFADTADHPDVPAGDDEEEATEETETRRLTVKEWSPSERPRERLMHHGAHALSDAELLAILLRTGTRQEDVIQISRNILQRFRTLSHLASRDYRELQQIGGIGPTKAITLTAAFEIGRRMKADPFAKRPLITGPRDVAAIYIPQFRGITKEQFHIMILNSASQMIRMEMVSEGSLNSSIVHPREVFRIAIVENAASIIGIHNHPSGNPTPSREDIAITRQLAEAGKILGIEFHDHIIIAGEDFVSMADRGYL